jgi:hypothetical protein
MVKKRVKGSQPMSPSDNISVTSAPFPVSLFRVRVKNRVENRFKNRVKGWLRIGLRKGLRIG